MLLFFVFFHFFLQFNYFDSQNNHLNFKQDPITNVWSIFRNNDISICFVHKSQKLAIFGLTCKDKRSRDLVTIGPIFFFFFFFKDAQDSKEKSQRAARRHPYAFSNNQKNRGGGGGAIMAPPPPPGLIRVNTYNLLNYDKTDLGMNNERCHLI